MRMVLQSAFTDRYLARNRDWTADLSKARIFDEWLEAYQFTLDQELVDTFIVPLAVESAPAISPLDGPADVPELQLK